MEEGLGAPCRHQRCRDSIELVLPKGTERAVLGATWRAGGSGASRLHRSCFFHAFVHQREEFPHPAGAGGLPREARGSSSCRTLLGGWENDPERSPLWGGSLELVWDCESQSFCPQSQVPSRAALLPRGTDISCDLKKTLLASGFI